MNFVIPMAGRGQRFVNAGYKLPKMLIEAHGKTLLEWSISSLPLELCTNLVCIILKEHETEFALSSIIKSIYGKKVKLSFCFIETVTRGQAETVYMAKELLDGDKDLLIFNIDTMFSSGTLPAALQRNDVDGVLGAFNSDEKRFSFAQIGQEGIVTKTAEKEVISNHALTGLYHFKNPADFETAASYYMENNLHTNNEFYIAPMYNYLIERGKKYILDTVDRHFILGTPEELEHFLAAQL
jgi:dTDP-glucose pyrophosphorylase